MKITTNEAHVLNLIAYNLYQPTNGDRPEAFRDTASIWSHSIGDASIACKIARRSIPGVVASLSKKGLVRCGSVGDTSDMDTVALTREGFAAWESVDAKTNADKLYKALVQPVVGGWADDEQ